MSGLGSINLTNQFLIAMPGMADDHFAGSVVYLCEHTERGALGLVINKPIDITIANLFERVEMALDREDLAAQPVYFGGPVQTDRGFVLHRPIGGWQSTLAVNSHIGLTSSRDVLQSVGHEGDPSEIIVTLGYSGWSAGQLEDELGQNAWLTVPAQPHILFGMPFEDRLPAAMDALGISFANLAEDAGHA